MSCEESVDGSCGGKRATIRASVCLVCLPFNGIGTLEGDLWRSFGCWPRHGHTPRLTWSECGVRLCRSLDLSSASRAFVRHHRYSSRLDQLLSLQQDAAGSIQRSDIWTLQGHLWRSATNRYWDLFPPLNLWCLRYCRSTCFSDSWQRRWFAAISKLFPNWHGLS